MDFQERLKRSIERRGALAELARLTGLTPRAIKKIADGVTENPGIRTVERLVEALDSLENLAPQEVGS